MYVNIILLVVKLLYSREYTLIIYYGVQYNLQPIFYLLFIILRKNQTYYKVFKSSRKKSVTSVDTVSLCNPVCIGRHSFTNPYSLFHEIYRV